MMDRWDDEVLRLEEERDAALAEVKRLKGLLRVEEAEAENEVHFIKERELAMVAAMVQLAEAAELQSELRAALPVCGVLTMTESGG